MGKVGILGATGYTGLELVKLLINHPKMEISYLGSNTHKGKRVSEVFPFLEPFSVGKLHFEDYESIPPDVELLFLALPHEVSMEIAPRLLERGYKVVDLSGAYRFKNLEDFKIFYGFEHRYPDLLEEAVYGLPELFREEIKNARLVANPGCYPTATLLALYPLLREASDLIFDDVIVVHALSGVSGAGRGLKQHFHFPEMINNMFPYKVVGHRHIPEMEFVINRIPRVVREIPALKNGKLQPSSTLKAGNIELTPEGLNISRTFKVRFTPTVVPIDRGMISTIYVRAKRFDIVSLYREAYKDEYFVRVADQPPKSKEVANTNFAFVYPAYDERTETAVVVCAIDNLLKGASGQALQNANLMLGYDEGEGLKHLVPSIV